MKTIKIAYVGFWDNFDYKAEQMHKIMAKHYDVQVVEPKQAEYIISAVFGEKYEYCQYSQIRIMVSHENYIPDFNFIDYAISSYPIKFFDRCCQNPMFARDSTHFKDLSRKSREYDKSILDEKIYFSNFICGHESEFGLRGDFFRKLSEYKRIESPGTYLNNMPDGQKVNWRNDSKTNFQRKCKFTLCFESTKHEGFVTEKIVDAFYSDTIPVYYGSDSVKDVFNEKAFINVADYPSWDAVIDKIKELDQDDEKYLEMLCQPILVDSEMSQKIEKELEDFLCNIFDQPYEKAYRRSRVYLPLRYEQYVKRCGGWINKILAISKRAARSFKKILRRK